MGLFGFESQKEKEDRESKALSAILAQFEKEINQKNQQVSLENKIENNKIPASKIYEKSNNPVKINSKNDYLKKLPSVNDLVKFLSEKNIIKLDEWDEFINRK